mmetsp:Transcript_25724/g.76130  ORF Transcript_25724/g.76130 Transcript_25724/m.76130 type:complete len:398 (+) Transcript_25724:558-1751(+)
MTGVARPSPAAMSCVLLDLIVDDGRGQVQRRRNELRLLCLVHLAKACCRRRARRAARKRNAAVGNAAALVLEARDHARLDVEVGAHVHRLLLAPHHLCVGVAPELAAHQVKREGRQLLQAHNSDAAVVEALTLALRVHLVEDLAGAEEHALDVGLGLGARRSRLWHEARVVHDEALEAHALDAHVVSLVVKLVQAGARLGVAQQVLRAHHDERLPEGAVDLPAQHVEQVGGRGAVDNLPVGRLDLRAQVATSEPLALVHVGQQVRVLVRHLQEALNARRRVLRALAVVAMRELHNEAALAQPFGLAAAQELVKDDLRGVCKVAKLRLPRDQAVGVLHRVAQLEAQHSILGKRRVGHREHLARLALVHVRERHILVTALLVGHHRVAVAERAALDVLS